MERMRADLDRRLELTRDPLHTVLLFRLAQDRYFWYFQFHHVILDGYSGAMVVRRVAEVYSALVTGALAVQPDPRPLRDLLDEDLAYRVSYAFLLDQEMGVPGWPTGRSPRRWPTGCPPKPTDSRAPRHSPAARTNSAGSPSPPGGHRRSSSSVRQRRCPPICTG